ncbi:DUF6602 domain-containing protein [Planctomicrobium piriforme]|uniref:DUF6602 domain-containing protein n=1 Tax=Planctomicrobium piriforme TaxID=1576369 RepID=A0A1I3M7R1_9PLAN|nr:DUF6602 domain-containing protein [Planctomicrobium piriforme]SFI92870.1 hypothetical protein SAMN05421753_113182 [Planctomicrobium piriforme]
MNSRILDRLKHAERQMILRLEEIRASFKHAGNKGANVEEVVRSFLREYLPPIHTVGQGEVIDSIGNESRQLDVVITNDAHPPINGSQGVGLFFIEGVSCAAEVKTILDGKELESALRNASQFKRLKPDMTLPTQTVSTDSDYPRFVERRPYFLLAFESKLKNETLAQRVREWCSLNAKEIPDQIDAIFTLDGGSIFNLGDGDGFFHGVGVVSGNRSKGFVRIEPEQDQPLLNMLCWMNLCMHKINYQVNPISRYMGSIDWMKF